MLRIQLEPAYVLSHRPYRESSALLEIFTAGYGRVGVVARGVRGSRRGAGSPGQPFRRLLVSWSERGDLGTLTQSEPDGPPLALSGEAVFYGWYVNELLLRLLTRHDPHPGLFREYEATLSALAGTQAEPALRRFEMRLLGELGYGMPLSGRLDPQRHYHLDWDRGPQPALGEGQGSYSGATLNAIAEERLDAPEVLREAKRLLRAALARQLGGRELETPRLLRELRRSTAIPDIEPGD